MHHSLVYTTAVQLESCHSDGIKGVFNSLNNLFGCHMDGSQRFTGYFPQIFRVFLWYDEGMTFRNGIYIREGQTIIILIDFNTGYFALYYLTKDAVFHNYSPFID
jgi:hypothetical protein